MAVAISFTRFIRPRPPSPLKNFHRPSIPRFHLVHAPLSLPQTPPLIRRRYSAPEKNGGVSENLAEREKGEVKEGERALAVEREIREMMAARKEESSKADELLGGVAEEVREIDWPEFGKMVGTTGVVLAVIAGSSIALLTVNTILAELSDRIFAGKGVQDFFSG